MKLTNFSASAFIALAMFSCGPSADEKAATQMKSIIATELAADNNGENIFNSDARLAYLDAELKSADAYTALRINYQRASVFMEKGDINKAVELYYQIHMDSTVKGSYFDLTRLEPELAFAYLRMGEVNNCLSNHTAESCIYPIQGGGLHKDPAGSSKAIEMYEKILARNPDQPDIRWLLNIAYMTLGKYPDGVPKKYLLLNPYPETDKVIPFEDVAAILKLNVNDRAGGVITEDFDNDGYLDIVTSAWDLRDPMHYFHNNADGTFTDLSKKSGLSAFTGSLNINHTDYNNDGFKDIFVLRGGWKGRLGNNHNSLLKNNGDGTFTEVTIQSGLLSAHPTQTATWNDFNNDGWVDLFIGNESMPEEAQLRHPCEFYINNQNGTFTNVAAEMKVDLTRFVKGVTSADYDNDGWKDIFVSTMEGRFLLRNKGIKGKIPAFENVTKKAGLAEEKNSSFATWFFDFDNDGWQDIIVCDYSFKKTLAFTAGEEAMGKSLVIKGQPFLYRNNGNGTFKNITNEAGLFKSVFAMGSSFGDIDNDGWLDMFFGTGNPNFDSLIPNRMFRNNGGNGFNEVTRSARVGSLQKGHSVAFADLDNDGDQDIYMDLGGAYEGDAFPSALYMNPGQNKNNWISINLEGIKSNKAAIGSQLKLSVMEAGKMRYIYRDVNSGGSFGSAPFRREIGIGAATVINEIEIKWHGSGLVQKFKNVKPNQFVKITEGSDVVNPVKLKTLNFKKLGAKAHHHMVM
ncbi:FG-GAP-like repeat-containing protein [Pedobacter psychroterrae]|uniref:CRTAC1 family protein n=1 Tax=Pedobacter psychroterrae TaxID=2530453 RepID=A0A4R0NLR0_9SPHI|nr:FG-GAP-like repeat-containing protein [Pedobacter psychroterrae]TCD01760.1 CRTAC1 family protein [Pedobacter psychroterrae]